MCYVAFYRKFADLYPKCLKDSLTLFTCHMIVPRGITSRHPYSGGWGDKHDSHPTRDHQRERSGMDLSRAERGLWNCASGPVYFWVCVGGKSEGSWHISTPQRSSTNTAEGELFKSLTFCSPRLGHKRSLGLLISSHNQACVLWGNGQIFGSHL